MMTRHSDSLETGCRCVCFIDGEPEDGWPGLERFAKPRRGTGVGVIFASVRETCLLDADDLFEPGDLHAERLSGFDFQNLKLREI